MNPLPQPPTPIRRRLAVALALGLLGALTSAPALTPVQFRTVAGDIVVELLDDAKPATVENFLRYVRSNAYQNTFFHRCVPGFVAQGGGWTVTNSPLDTNLFLSVEDIPRFAPVTNEFHVGPKVSNHYGTIAMAKSPGNPDSATSEWFFNLGDNSAELDAQNGGFTVFGHVTQGTSVLNLFSQLGWGTGLVDLRKYYGTNLITSVFKELPVRYIGFQPPRYRDLIYVDITLLQVHVLMTIDQTQEISWNSVRDRANHVEFTTDWPPVWTVLSSTNGSGGRMRVADDAANAPARFYRVRVD
jgi:cyclophilin family peptidyl-prolyl cis-trans isomerase